MGLPNINSGLCKMSLRCALSGSKKAKEIEPWQAPGFLAVSQNRSLNNMRSLRPALWESSNRSASAERRGAPGVSLKVGTKFKMMQVYPLEGIME